MVHTVWNPFVTDSYQICETPPFTYESFISAIRFLFEGDYLLLQTIDYDELLAIADYLQAPSLHTLSLNGFKTPALCANKLAELIKHGQN